MKILKERSKWVWETILPRCERLKLFISKDRAYLLDIYYQTLAYDSGIYFQAQSDYSKRNLGAVSVISNVRKNAEIYNPDDIQKAQDRVNNLYTGSLTPERAERIRKLNLTGEFMQIAVYSDSVKPTSKLTSLNEGFKNWLPRYDRNRKSRAKQLKSNFKLKKSFINNLQQIAFDEILALVNSGAKLTDEQKGVIVLLEHGIDVVFPMFLKDLGIKTELNLKTFRKSCEGGFNTICRSCEKPLLRSNLKSYCLIRENLSCYLARKKPTLIKTKSSVNTNASTKCDNCGVLVVPPLIYKVKGIRRPFCSNKCRHTFRQKLLRSSKTFNNFAPSLH